MQLLNSKILSNDKNTRYSNKKAQDTRVTCAFLSVVAFSYYKDGGDAGFVANIVCVITERKCLHFKAECQPGYRGSHGDAVLRFFKIAINPRIDDIEKQVEQEVQLVSRLCANTYFDTICVHPIKSAYTLSKFAYSLLKMHTVKCTDKLKFMVAKQILDWGTQILLSTRLPEIQIFCTAPLVQSLFHHFHEMLIP